MMGRITAIILLAFVAQAHVQESFVDARDFNDTSVSKLIERLSDRALKAWRQAVFPPWHQADLDNVALGKPSHLAMPSGCITRPTAVCFAQRHGVPEHNRNAAPAMEVLQGRHQEEALQQRHASHEVSLTRRWAALAAAQAAAAAIWMPPQSVNAAVDAPSSTTPMTELDYKTFKIQVPKYYSEVQDAEAFLLLRDLRPEENNGNIISTISLYKASLPEDGPKSLSELGSAEEFAAKIVQEKKNLFKNIDMKLVETRKDSTGQEFYQVDFVSEQTGLGLVKKRVLSSVTIAEGAIYKLNYEIDASQYDAGAGDVLRQSLNTFFIKPPKMREAENQKAKKTTA